MYLVLGALPPPRETLAGAFASAFRLRISAGYRLGIVILDGVALSRAALGV